MNVHPAVLSPVPPAAASQPSENDVIHTHILRCTLAEEDSRAYWSHADPSLPIDRRAAMAFDERWFGIKSEARVRTLLTDMALRFDAYPEALALLQRVGRIPAALRAAVCHVHAALADPIYRAFVGDLLPSRRDEGRRTIDRPAVARWVGELAPDRWSAVTRIKFASNLLSTALDAGLLRGRRDPRELPVPAPPDAAIGYVLYLLRTVRIAGSMTENAYLRSLGLNAADLARRGASIPGVRIAVLGDTVDVTFLEPTLLSWGLKYLQASA